MISIYSLSESFNFAHAVEWAIGWFVHSHAEEGEASHEEVVVNCAEFEVDDLHELI